jgi:hypothetical protein
VVLQDCDYLGAGGLVQAMELHMGANEAVMLGKELVRIGEELARLQGLIRYTILDTRDGSRMQAVACDEEDARLEVDRLNDRETHRRFVAEIGGQHV